KLTPGKPAMLTITATRAPGFTEEIAITAAGLPPTVTAALKNIPKGQNEVKVQLSSAANAPGAQIPLTITGKARFHPTDFSVNAPPVTLVVSVIPFELKVEPTPVKIVQGTKVKLKVTAQRKGYAGPIALEIRNLPANVTAAKGTIGQGQTAVEMELT